MYWDLDYWYKVVYYVSYEYVLDVPRRHSVQTVCPSTPPSERSSVGVGERSVRCRQYDVTELLVMPI